MSWNPALDPHCPTGDEVDAIDTIIIPRARDLGGFEVRRALPAPRRQMVGPFIFFDQMGPAELLPTRGLDVRPHPHIGLATISYLFRGRMHHRDSLGTDAWIEPGAVNWMVAGRGITHSERTDGEIRNAPHNLFGIQTWVALPAGAEDGAAGFEHAPAEALPDLQDGGATDFFNLGYGRGYSVREIVETCRKVTGVDFPAEETPRRPGDPPRLVADNRKVRSALADLSFAFDDVEKIVATAWAWERKRPF